MKICWMKYVWICRTVCVVLLFTCVAGLPAYGQNINVNHADGTMVKVARHVDINGNPYFSKSWTTGDVRYTDGTVGNDFKLRYDQVNDELLFQVKDEEYTFSKPVREFSLLDDNGDVAVFRNGFKAHNKYNSKTFYQILYDDAKGSSLIKKNLKFIVDRNVYGSANANKLIQERITYYLSAEDMGLIEVKRDKKSLLQALDPSRSTELENFIKSQKLTFKSDKDMIVLLEYYHTL